jgi:VPDSG-CTERM motif
LNNALAAGTGYAASVCNIKFRLKMIPTNKLGLLSAAVCAAMLAFSPKAATALTFNDAHVVGTITPAIPVNPTVVSAYINYMIALAPGHSGTFHNPNPAFAQTITRSSNTFASLPDALVPGAVTGFGTTINLGAGVYSYLFAKYDGQNDVSQVWYVGNLSGIVTIPALGPGGHPLTLWKLFPPGGQVPDGGATVMLLGAALGALGMARRFLKI